MASPRRRDPYSLNLLRLMTQGVNDSPAVRAMRGETMVRQLIEITESPVMRIARGETAAQRIAAVIDSPVMRAVRGDPTWNALVTGEPTLLTMLTQPSITTRLNQVVTDLQASRFDQAELLARATYEDVLFTTSSGVGLAETPAGYEGLLQEAEQLLALALDSAGLDGATELSETKAAVDADVADAVSGEGVVAGEVVTVSAETLNETNRLLRELINLASTPDRVVRALTVALLVLAIIQALLTGAALLHADPVSDPPPRPARVTRTGTSTETVTAPGAPRRAGQETHSELQDQLPPLHGDQTR